MVPGICPPKIGLLFVKKENKMKIYVIGGKAKSGKNTLGERIKYHLIEKGHYPCIMRITEPLYNYAKTYFQYNEKIDKKPREFLQNMGIEIIQKKMGKKNFLLNRLFEDIEILNNFFDTFIITDARLINEFKTIKEKYKDAVIIKLERENYNDELTETEKKHITELEIEKYNNYNYLIKNTSLKQLDKAAKDIVEKENYTDEGEIL